MQFVRASSVLFYLLLELITPTEAMAQRFNFDSPIGTVMTLYHDFSYEAVIDQNVPYDTLENQPKAVLERYLDSDLTRLILKDQSCAISSGGICNIDFRAMWDSQDEMGTSVEIKETSNPNEIAVFLKQGQTDPEEKLIYQLVKTKRGWRIHDIVSPKWSLQSLLKGEETGK